MPRLLTEHDRNKCVIVGIMGGRILQGVVTSAGDDICHIEGMMGDDEFVARVRQDSIAYVTFLIPSGRTEERKVPVQRKVDSVTNGI